MADKQDAIQEAKDAALGSVSFAIYGTKNDADSLRKNSVLAARNVVAVRKNMLLVVAKFQTFHTILANIKSALGKKGDASTKLNAVNAALSSGGNAYALAEAEQESKPSVAGSAITPSGGKDGGGLSLGAIAGLAMAIPFLLSPEVRDMISGFFDGFLKGLGLSNEAIDKAKTFLLIAAGVVGAVLSVKALAPVFETFNALKNLAQAMGILGEATAMQKDQVDKERAKIDKEKDDAKKGRDKGKEEIKKNKDEIKKARKAGKGSKTKIGKLWDKGKFLVDKVAPKLKRMIPNILKAIPFVGTVLGIGFILYDLFSIGQDIYDVFFGDEDEEDKEEQQTEQTQAPAAAATAKPLPEPAATPEVKPSATSTPAATPAAAPALSSGGGESSGPASAPTSTPAPAAPASGAQVATASIVVQQAETDMVQQPIVNIAVVDNTTTVIATDNKQIKAPREGSTNFSNMVGAG